MQELKNVAPTVPVQTLDQLVSVSFGLLSKESEKLGLPEFPIDNLSHAAQILVVSASK